MYAQFVAMYGNPRHYTLREAEVLFAQLPALIAQQELIITQAVINGGMYPHTNKTGQGKINKWVKKLQDFIGLTRPDWLPKERPPIIEHDPDKAADWFGKQGLNVVHNQPTETIQSDHLPE